MPVPQLRLTKGKRFNEIFHILLEHNFAGLLREIVLYAQRGPAQAAPVTAARRATPALPHRLRRVMEDLGPTFIKIGQLLGTRPDLIPNDFIEEFKKMYDQTTPTPFPQVREAVEAELGRPLTEVFASFEERPLASASIAQVHRGTLRSGEQVAVKVQHPGIEERMRTDFEIMRGIVAFTEKVFAASHIWQPVKHLEEIRQMLNRELDFRNELRTQQQVGANFRSVPEVKIPHPYEQWTTRRVLVMEYIEGFKLRSRNQPELVGLDAANIARIITHAMARQIFVDRLFHADPSPGNILILSDRQIALLDFGAFGQVSKRRSELILRLILALQADNLEETTRVIIELCEQHKDYEPKRFQADVERLLDYYEAERPSPADPVLLQRIIDLAHTHGMLLPSDFMLITRALYQFDGMCKELDPDYDLVRVLTPFVSRTLKQRLLSSDVPVEAISTAAQELGRFVAGLPSHLENLLVRAERGQLSTQLELKGLDEYKRHRATLAFFLGFTALLAATVLAAAVAYAYRGPEGFSVALFTGLVALLAWSLVAVATRSGLHRR